MPIREPTTISPDPPENRGLDYVWLREEGARLTQQLSSDFWTDYNEHDPGVTTLEQLCYALTELSYRAEIPIADLLTQEITGKIDPYRQALFPAPEIFPVNPVTIPDYRKLLIDRVEGAGNAWLWPREDPPGGVAGLYEIALLAAPAEGHDCPPDPGELVAAARRVYSSHRALGEDFHSIFVLQAVPTAVFARVSIDATLPPETILAGILFQVGLLLAPEPRRHSLRSALAEGREPAAILEGPLLEHGLIDDRELLPKARQISVQEISGAIVRNPGVASVHDLRVEVRRGNIVEPFRGNESIPVPDDEILELETAATNGEFTIRLFRNGVEVRPDPETVRYELERRWDEQRRTYPLAVEYEEDLGMPQGRWRDLKQYFSIQNQYPNVYGIGSFGLPEDATTPRRAQARQLKGYLLVYDQLLANYFAQLAQVGNLYSTEIGLQHTYFFQYLYDSVPDVEPLLKADDPVGYFDGLPALVASQDPFLERRNRFLRFLLALYAEELDPASVSPFPCDDRGTEATRLLRARLTLLRNLVPSTRDRGRGLDELEPDSDTGMQIKTRVQLGMRVRADPATAGDPPLSGHGGYIDRNFTPVDSVAGPGAPIAQGQTVAEGLLRVVQDLGSFRVGSLPGEDGAALVCRSPADDQWRLVARYPDQGSALAAAAALAGLMQDARDRPRQALYIVEHVLLRFALADGETADDEGFVYDFTLTAVIFTCASSRDDPGYRTFACEVLRANTPAHMVVNLCLPGSGQRQDFEDLYRAWREALPQRDSAALRRTSAALRDFLESCESAPCAAGG